MLFGLRKTNRLVCLDTAAAKLDFHKVEMIKDKHGGDSMMVWGVLRASGS